MGPSLLFLSFSILVQFSLSNTTGSTLSGLSLRPSNVKAGLSRTLLSLNDNQSFLKKTTTCSTKLSKSNGSTKKPSSATAKRHTLFSGRLPPASSYNRPLLFWENMISGAISRSFAQTMMHPANTMKTILQSRNSNRYAQDLGLAAGSEVRIGELLKPRNLKMLTRGAGAQFLLSVPHGACNFAVLEYTRALMGKWFGGGGKGAKGNNGKKRTGLGLDFLSSGIATFACSIVSTPQMMITDNIMSGTYPNLPSAVRGLYSEGGINGFYTGWLPGITGKIPSYGLTWVFFQQIKELQQKLFKRTPRDIENALMGCCASTLTVCIMIPMDTVKTRLVTQLSCPDLPPYKGIFDCAVRVYREEGVGAFYRGLPPRLMSVVPMIGLQFGIYEFMKKAMLASSPTAKLTNGISRSKGETENEGAIEEVLMGVAADDESPTAPPRIRKKK